MSETVHRMGHSNGAWRPYSTIAFEIVGTDMPRNLAICAVGQ